MKQKVLIAFVCILFSKNIFGQWETGAGAGISLPITGYGEVLKTGWLLDVNGRYRFKKGNFATGIKAQFVRLQKDKNSSDQFQNARMTIAPLIFTAEYCPAKGKFEPYATGGLGITFFSFHYETSSTDGKSLNNVSFTMMPSLGFRYGITKNIYPYVEWDLVLLADGPPIGFPISTKMTGYNAFVGGICYRFN